MKIALVFLLFLLPYVILTNGGVQSSVPTQSPYQIISLNQESARGYLNKIISKDRVNTLTVDGATPLMVAANFGLNRQARRLFLKNSSITAIHPIYGVTALIIAASKGNVDIANLLMYNATRQDRVGAVITASKNGHLSVLKLFFPRKPVAHSHVDINAQNGNDTALTAAIRANKKLVVHFLLACGAGVNCTTQNKFTPLAYALLYKHQDIAQILMDKGGTVPEITWKDYSGDKVQVSDRLNNLDFLCNKNGLIPALVNQYAHIHKDDFVIIDRNSLGLKDVSSKDQYTFSTFKKQQY